MNLRTLADDIEHDHPDYAAAVRIAAPVVDALAAEWPSIREEIHAEVLAAVWALSPEGWSRDATVKNAARTAVGQTIECLSRPVAIPGRSHRRAREASALEDEGMAVEEAAAAAGIDPGTVVAVRQAAASGYFAPVVLAHGDPVWPEGYADEDRIRRINCASDAMASLPEGDRALLVDAVTLGHRETARRHGIARSTVSRRKFRASPPSTPPLQAKKQTLSLRLVFHPLRRFRRALDD